MKTSFNINEIAHEVHDWASRTFPGRVPEASLSKLVLEEIPELLQHRKNRGVDGIDLELADCFILLMDLACIWKVDLMRAIHEKMQINEHRLWKLDKATGFYNHTSVEHKPLDFSAAEELCQAALSDPGKIPLETEGGTCD